MPNHDKSAKPANNSNGCANQQWQLLHFCELPKIKSTPTPCRYRVAIDGSRYDTTTHQFVEILFVRTFDVRSPYYAIGKSVCEFFNEFPQCGYINRVKIYGAVER